MSQVYTLNAIEVKAIDMFKDLTLLIEKEYKIDLEVYELMKYDIFLKIEDFMGLIYIKFIKKHLIDVMADNSI